MISVAEAAGRIVGGLTPVAAEVVGLAEACGRVLAEDVAARRTQPWAAVSAMDGYAVRSADVASAPVVLRQVGHVPAGQGHAGAIGPGECVRIFTGAPLPAGADAIVIQENVDADGDDVRVREGAKAGRYVRPAGLDFRQGDVLLTAGRVLTARDIGLAAAMNVPWLSVRRRPRVAILATGDEIVRPGDPIGDNQIVSSNSLALAALVGASGGQAIDLGIAPDEADALRRRAGGAAGCDLLVTTGGASVGEHDLLRAALGESGLVLDFWRIAMRPGKPLMFGRMGDVAMIGMPGNPVSTLVCGLLFLRPAIRRLLGLADDGDGRETARLGCDLGANDRREDYLRGTLRLDGDGSRIATPLAQQDSSVLSALAAADCLVVRPPLAPAARAGQEVPVLRFPAGLAAF